MSTYTSRLTENQNDDLDGRIFDAAQQFGSRNHGTMQWTFDNHQLFNMMRLLINNEERHILKVNEPEPEDATKDKTLLPHVIAAKNAMFERGVDLAQFGEMFPKFLKEFDSFHLLGDGMWLSGNPTVKKIDYEHVIVAVRRRHSPDHVAVIPAVYANEYSEEMHDRNGEDFVANGWYNVAEDPSGEFNEFFTPLLEEGDEVLGWQPLPKYRF